MKASHFRKGNIVANEALDILKKGYVEMEARWIYEMAVKESGQEYNQYVDFFEPIPLTEEWLTRLGFKKLPLEGTYFKMIHGFGREREDSLVYHNGIILSLCQITDTGSIISEMTKRLDINYVHQLQNLYFSLTGEELTLKQE